MAPGIAGSSPVGHPNFFFCATGMGMPDIIQNVAARYYLKHYGLPMKQADEGPSSFMTWTTALDQLAARFAGGVGQSLYEYIETLHHRLADQERFQSIPGFTSWDYGNVGLKGKAWQIRVWQKSSSQYPGGEVDPNLLVSIEIDGVKVKATLLMGSKKIYEESFSRGDVSSSGLGMNMGEAWEKTLTGSVDYGD